MPRLYTDVVTVAELREAAKGIDKVAALLTEVAEALRITANGAREGVRTGPHTVELLEPPGEVAHFKVKSLLLSCRMLHGYAESFGPGAENKQLKKEAQILDALIGAMRMERTKEHEHD